MGTLTDLNVTFSVEPRSGPNRTIDANTIIPLGKPVSIQWIDGNNTYLNFHASIVSGTLYQIDSLYNTPLANKYMNQIFFSPGVTQVFARSQNNGLWNNWLALH